MSRASCCGRLERSCAFAWARHRTACVLAMLLLGLVAAGCRTEPHAAPVPAPAPSSVAALTPAAPSGNEAVVLATERCGQLFIVKALINGAGPFRLGIDT